MMNYLKIEYRLIKDYLTSFTVFLKILNLKKKSSENDQSSGHFQSFLFVPHPKSESPPLNQLIKKIY